MKFLEFCPSASSSTSTFCLVLSYLVNKSLFLGQLRLGSINCFLGFRRFGSEGFWPSLSVKQSRSYLLSALARPRFGLSGLEPDRFVGLQNRMRQRIGVLQDA